MDKVPSHGENAKYEEFGHETYAISFQMKFVVCSKGEITAAMLLIIKGHKGQMHHT